MDSQVRRFLLWIWERGLIVTFWRAGTLLGRF
jgi:hypothetical protein